MIFRVTRLITSTIMASASRYRAWLVIMNRLQGKSRSLGASAINAAGAIASLAFSAMDESPSLCPDVRTSYLYRGRGADDCYSHGHDFSGRALTVSVVVHRTTRWHYRACINRLQSVNRNRRREPMCRLRELRARLEPSEAQTEQKLDIA